MFNAGRVAPASSSRAPCSPELRTAEVSMKSVLATLALATNVFAQAPLIEDFDEVGSDWSNTHFPGEVIFGDGVFTREALDVALGAPDTQPPLPINAGGDLEGRYSEVV